MGEEKLSGTSQTALPPPDNEQEERDPNSPTGVRFAILYACILLGNFFTGYVSGRLLLVVYTMRLTLYLRTPVVSRR